MNTIFTGPNRIDWGLLLIGIIACVINLQLGAILFWGLLCVIIYRHRDAAYGFMGNLAYHNRHYKKAINWYKTCIKFPVCKPKKINTYVYLEIRYGSVENASKNFNKVLETREFNDTELREINMTKALLEWGRGDNKAALDILYKELEINELPVLFETISYILLADEQYEKALEFSKDAYSKVPEDYIVTSNLGICYYFNNDKEKAYKVLKPLCDHGLQLLEPYYFVGIMEQENGNIEEAIKYFKKGGTLPETFIKLVPKSKIISLYKELSATIDDSEVDAPKEIAASKDDN